MATGLLLSSAIDHASTVSANGAEPFKCSNRTLRGDYGFAIDGTLTLPSPAPTPLLRGLAMQRFDGHGSFTQVDFITLDGVPATSDWRPATGTYQVNADCTGTMKINFEDGSPSLNLRLVVVDRGRKVLSIAEGLATGSVGTKVR